MSSGLQTCTSPQHPFMTQNVGLTQESCPNPSSPALSTTSSGSGTSKKTEPPKRLRYWLIDMIDNGEIPGLRWENAERTIFRIPWKHAGKNNWKEEDCRIFQEWAIHRGKYKKGDKVDPATWKTRLRCALNKLGDIKELKHRSNLEGNDPFRVYQLMPEQDRAHESELYPREEWSKESNMNYEGNSPRYSAEYLQSCHQDNIRRMVTATRLSSPFQDMANGNSPGQQFGLERKPMVVENHHYNGNPFHEQNSNTARFRTSSNEAREIASSARPLQEAFDDVRSQQEHQIPQANLLATPPGYSAATAEDFQMDANGGYNPTGMGYAPPTMEYRFPTDAPQPHEMDIFIQYRGQQVAYCHAAVPLGCRVYYGNADLQQIAVQTHKLPSGIFGSESLHQIRLPECEHFSSSQKQVALTNHVLDNIKRGLIFSYEDGCFYTQRLCQSRVFIFGPETKGDTPEKLERAVKVKIFDYKKFHGQLQRYIKQGYSKMPEYELKASFGQNWSIKTPIEKNLVTLTMVPRLATYYEYKIEEHFRGEKSLGGGSILQSIPDSYDKLVELSEQKTDSLLTELLRNIDTNTLRPFTDSEMTNIPQQPFPLATAAPVTSSSQDHYAHQVNGFKRNVIPIAPLALHDVEMT